MELLSPPRENFLYYRKLKPPKKFLYFLKRKLFVYFGKRKTPQKFLIFQETELISGKEYSKP